MKISLLSLALLVLTSPLSQSVHAQVAATSVPNDHPATATEPQPKDAVLPAWRAGLVDMAFEAVSKMPLEPHVKNRSRAQQATVEAALELDLPLRAEGYAVQIENWRRASGLADVALHLIDTGFPDAGRKRMEASKAALAEAMKSETQGWRIGRVRAKLAACYLALGEFEAAMQLEVGMPDSETAVVESAKAAQLTGDAFDAQLKNARAIVEGGNFEQLKAVLATCSTLYARFFEDEVRRAEVLELAQLAWRALPVTVRIDTSFSFARAALLHADRATATQLVDAADELRHAAEWRPELSVTLGARFAKMRAELGQPAKALEEAQAARSLFDKSRERITDIYRGRCLRPLAEAYHAMGAEEDARAVYALALEQGFENPNGRPRAEDLAATCLSMARADVEPSTELWTRIGEISDALGAPW